MFQEATAIYLASLKHFLKVLISVLSGDAAICLTVSWSLHFNTVNHVFSVLLFFRVLLTKKLMSGGSPKH